VNDMANTPEVPQLAIRLGTVEDIHPLMELARLAVEDNGLTSPDMIKMCTTLYGCLARQNGMVAIIGEPGKIPEAAIALQVSEPWYSREKTITELAIFVHPDFRSAKGGRAARLCEFAKKVQEELALPMVIGVLSTTRTEAKKRLYERSFGPPAGHYWILGAKTGQWGQ